MYQLVVSDKLSAFTTACTLAQKHPSQRYSLSLRLKCSKQREDIWKRLTERLQPLHNVRISSKALIFLIGFLKNFPYIEMEKP